MKLFSCWLGFAVIFYSAGSSEASEASNTAFNTEAAVSSTQFSSTVVCQIPSQTTTASLDALLSDIFKDKSPLCFDPKAETQLASQIVDKYDEFLTDSFKDIAGKDVDLQGLTSELTGSLLELWSVYIRQSKGNFFEQTASIATKASIIGTASRYLYDIGSFKNLDFVSFLSDGRFSELFSLAVEANSIFDDINANILNGKTSALMEKVIATYIDAVKKSRGN